MVCSQQRPKVSLWDSVVALEKDSNVCSQKRDRLKSQEWPDDSAVMFLKSLTSQVRWAWVEFGDHVETHALFAIVQNLYQAMHSCGMFSSSIGLILRFLTTSTFYCIHLISRGIEPVFHKHHLLLFFCPFLNAVVVVVVVVVCGCGWGCGCGCGCGCCGCGCWLLVVGCWLLVVGGWWLVVGCWLLVVVVGCCCWWWWWLLLLWLWLWLLLLLSLLLLWLLLLSLSSWWLWLWLWWWWWGGGGGRRRCRRRRQCYINSSRFFGYSIIFIHFRSNLHMLISCSIPAAIFPFSQVMASPESGPAAYMGPQVGSWDRGVVRGAKFGTRISRGFRDSLNQLWKPSFPWPVSKSPTISWSKNAV